MKKVLLILGISLLIAPPFVMVADGGPFTGPQWTGLIFLMILGFFLCVAGSPQPDEQDVI